MNEPTADSGTALRGQRGGVIGVKGGLPTGGVGGTGPDQEWGAFESILGGRAGSRVCLCHQTAGVGMELKELPQSAVSR